MRTATCLGLIGAAAFLSGCTLKTEHKIEPIEINMNIYLHVDKELDSFFDKIDAQSTTLKPEASTEGTGQ